MSLFIPNSDGLLGTHVTWHDVEEAMRSALRTDATFGETRKVTNIGEMKGFLSRIALIEPDWRGSSEEKLPGKLVVKIASQLTLIEIAQATKNEVLEKEKVPQMGPVTREMHNREAKIYEILEKYAYGKVLHSKMYASKSFEEDSDLKAFMIFDFIPNEHLPLNECISPDDLLPVVRAIASFSALGEKIPEEELKSVGGQEFWVKVLEDAREQGHLERTIGMIKATFSSDYHSICDKVLEMYRTFYSKQSIIEKFATIPEFLGHKPVLGHCDLWSSNLMFTKNEEGGSDFKGIIDFQTVSWCSPGIDLARLFVGVLAKKERREKGEFLMKTYYKTLLEELEGKAAPYSLEQLHDSYSLYFPTMAMIGLPALAGIAVQKSESTETLDKLVGLLEDVVSTHESNLKRFPTFFD